MPLKSSFQEPLTPRLKAGACAAKMVTENYAMAWMAECLTFILGIDTKNRLFLDAA